MCPDGVDLHEVLSYISPAIAQITGYSPGELMSMRPEQVDALIHMEDVLEESDPMRRLATLPPGGEAVGRMEYRIRCKDGRDRWVSDHCTVLKGWEGHISVAIGSL